MEREEIGHGERMHGFRGYDRSLYYCFYVAYIGYCEKDRD
jgi:hypothetical protein